MYVSGWGWCLHKATCHAVDPSSRRLEGLQQVPLYNTASSGWKVHRKRHICDPPCKDDDASTSRRKPTYLEFIKHAGLLYQAAKKGTDSRRTIIEQYKTCWSKEYPNDPVPFDRTGAPEDFSDQDEPFGSPPLRLSASVGTPRPFKPDPEPSVSRHSFRTPSPAGQSFHLDPQPTSSWYNARGECYGLDHSTTDAPRRKSTVSATYDQATVHAVINFTPVLHVFFKPMSGSDDPFPTILPMTGCTGAYSDASTSSPNTNIPATCIYPRGNAPYQLKKPPGTWTIDGFDRLPGTPVSIAATQIEGLVTPYNYTSKFRSVVVHGYANIVTNPAEKLYALSMITDNLLAQGWTNKRVPPTEVEIETAVLRMDIVSASAMVRTGGAFGNGSGSSAREREGDEREGLDGFYPMLEV